MLEVDNLLPKVLESSNKADNFSECVFYLLESSSDYDRGRLIMILWALWRTRLLNVMEAELLGLIEAISWVHSLGFSNVVFEFNAKSVVDIINGTQDNVSKTNDIEPKLYPTSRYKDEITKLVDIRNRIGINRTSAVTILASDADLYMASIDDKIIMKIGPKMDLRNLVPSNYQLATLGESYAVWENK
ncbi:hypothetical protein PTKIN_Ptkin06aG0118500 [Pterospermum kingtungense]